MNEQTALRKLKEGNIEGLDFLVQKYQLQAIRTAYLVVHDRALAEDIVQSAFIRVYQKFSQFDEERSFRNWFLRIVLNDAILLSKQRSRFISLEEKLETDNDFSSLLSTLEGEPTILLETAETSKEIWQVLAKLSPAQRAVIVQHYYLNLKEKEIALLNGSAQGTVKWHLHQARERLRSLITINMRTGN